MEKIYSASFKAFQIAATFLDRVVNDSRLADPHFEGDPYPEYDRLLKKAPLVRSFAAGGWMALGFDAVTDALKDPRFSVDLRNSPTISRFSRMTAGDGESILENSTLLNTDPPDHTRLRKLVRTGFLHKYVQSLEPRIRALIDDCLSNVQGQGEFDLVETLARPLPAYLIAEILGVEDTERDGFRRLTELYFRNSMVFNFKAQLVAVDTYRQLVEFMGGVVQRKRSQPGNDLISGLIAAEEDGEQLSAKEVTSTCILLMFAGYETTTRLIGSMVFLLSRHADQMRLLREQPQLIPNAVEESLRFEPPVQFLFRVAMQDMEFHGARIKRHQTVTICYAAANRDPAANERPHEFDITRTKVKHVAFGYGIHLCLGAELARLEARLALEMLLDRYRNLSAKSETPRWEPGYFVRGLEELVVNVS